MVSKMGRKPLTYPNSFIIWPSHVILVSNPMFSGSMNPLDLSELHWHNYILMEYLWDYCKVLSLFGVNQRCFAPVPAFVPAPVYFQYVPHGMCFWILSFAFCLWFELCFLVCTLCRFWLLLCISFCLLLVFVLSFIIKLAFVFPLILPPV